VISHDRWFLDRIATHVMAFEGDSEVRFWEGNFTDYEADRKSARCRRGPAASAEVQAASAPLGPLLFTEPARELLRRACRELENLFSARADADGSTEAAPMRGDE